MSFDKYKQLVESSNRDNIIDDVLFELDSVIQTMLSSIERDHIKKIQNTTYRILERKY